MLLGIKLQSFCYKYGVLYYKDDANVLNCVSNRASYRKGTYYLIAELEGWPSRQRDIGLQLAGKMVREASDLREQLADHQPPSATEEHIRQRRLIGLV